jgi:hypothetical protein
LCSRETFVCDEIPGLGDSPAPPHLLFDSSPLYLTKIFRLARLIVEQPEAVEFGENVGAAAQLEAIHRELAGVVFKAKPSFAAAHRAIA